MVEWASGRRDSAHSSQEGPCHGVGDDPHRLPGQQLVLCSRQEALL